MTLSVTDVNEQSLQRDAVGAGRVHHAAAGVGELLRRLREGGLLRVDVDCERADLVPALLEVLGDGLRVGHLLRLRRLLI